MNDLALGWIFVLVSVIAFGSFGVPVKSTRVRRANVHPLVFQTYKTFWTLIPSIVMLLFVEAEWSPVGILAGLSWVPAGIGAIVAINCLGVGVAQGVWSGILTLVGFSWGAFVFHEPLDNIYISVVGVILLSFGVIGLALSNLPMWNELASKFSLLGPLSEILGGKVEQDRLIPQEEPRFKNPDNGIHVDNDPIIIEDILKEKKPLLLPSVYSLDLKCFVINERVIGYLAAVFNGLWGGSYLAPMKLAGDSGKGIQWLFSFGTGSAIVNLTMWGVFIPWCLLHKKPIPSFHFRVMAIPGTLAGVLWSAGNIASIYAVLHIGQAVAIPSIQSALIVSGLWGIFYYRELRGFQIILWFCSAIVVIGGITILSLMKNV